MNYKISGFSDEISMNTDEQFAALCKLGVKYFEPRGIDGKNISELSETEMYALKGKMDKYGIKASSIGSPIGKIKVDEDFDAHFEVYKNVVKVAKVLDTKYIRVFSFFNTAVDAEWTEEKRAVVFERLQKMIEYAKENDVILLHENEKDIYGDIAERCEDIASKLCCDNFRLVFDPANFVQSGEDTMNAYNKLKGYIEYMHIKDAKKADGRVVPSGMGDGNVPYILTDLVNNGYNGFFSLEPHLGSFEGLADLELDDKMLDLPKSGEGTFTIAHNALVEILERI